MAIDEIETAWEREQGARAHYLKATEGAAEEGPRTAVGELLPPSCCEGPESRPALKNQRRRSPSKPAPLL